MQAINNFETNLIACWRPQKHAYHALTWNNQNEHWRPWYGTVIGGLSKHRSTAHDLSGDVQIKLQNNTMVQVQAAGEFLMLGTTRITLVKRIGGATIPNAWKNRELGPLIERTGVDLAVSLWNVLPPAVPVPPVAPVPPIVPAVASRLEIEPIPKRIAWLVAEDAAKNEEKCPITMEPISPITASVTSCFHTFDSEAIAVWLTNHRTCPQCRKPCVVSVAYTEA
jgi:hypothetical protein